MEAIVRALEAPLVVVVLVFLVYWLMEWIKRVLVKLKPIWVQPISLLVGTLVSGFVLYTYDFRPLDLGVARFALVDFILQGAVLAAVAGTFYDKFMDK